VNALLDILLRRDDRMLPRFCDLLTADGQQHIVDLFRRNGLPQHTTLLLTLILNLHFVLTCTRRSKQRELFFKCKHGRVVNASSKTVIVMTIDNRKWY